MLRFVLLWLFRRSEFTWHIYPYSPGLLYWNRNSRLISSEVTLKDMGWVSCYMTTTQHNNERTFQGSPDSMVHWANMGSIWSRQDPGGPHVGPMNLAIWVILGMGLDSERRRNTHARLLSLADPYPEWSLTVPICLGMHFLSCISRNWVR